MKILICSDTHSDNESLDELVRRHPKMDLYLHAGDSESDEFSIRPFLSVKGNCDYFSDLPYKRIIETPMGNLLIQHHPTPDYQIIKDYQVRFFVYGHTHMRRYEEIGSVLFLNPGSISFSRDNHPGSYIIMDISKEKYTIDFYSLFDKNIDVAKRKNKRS